MQCYHCFSFLFLISSPSSSCCTLFTNWGWNSELERQPLSCPVCCFLVLVKAANWDWCSSWLLSAPSATPQTLLAAEQWCKNGTFQSIKLIISDKTPFQKRARLWQVCLLIEWIMKWEVEISRGYTGRFVYSRYLDPSTPLYTAAFACSLSFQHTCNILMPSVEERCQRCLDQRIQRKSLVLNAWNLFSRGKL